MKSQKYWEVTAGDLRLTTEEVRAIDGYKNLSESDVEEFKDFIYNIAIVLYKLDTQNDVNGSEDFKTEK